MSHLPPTGWERGPLSPFLEKQVIWTRTWGISADWLSLSVAKYFPVLKGMS